MPKSVAAGGRARVSSILPRETAASRARVSLMVARREKEEEEEAGLEKEKENAGMGKRLTSSRSVRAASGVRKSVVPSTNTQSGRRRGLVRLFPL